MPTTVLSNPDACDESAASSPTALLTRLYGEQRQIDPSNPYLREHGTAKAIRNHVLTFRWYAAHLPESGSVLDWGCNHAPASCAAHDCSAGWRR